MPKGIQSGAAAFDSAERHGFVRVAVCVPVVEVADPATNARRTADLARQVAGDGARVALFPELGLSGYSCDDLFHQDALLGGVLAGLDELLGATSDLGCAVIVGAPLRVRDMLFNCAVVAFAGKVLGVVPKSYLPNYREFYEKRQFCAARQAPAREIELAGATAVPFGNDLVFDAAPAGVAGSGSGSGSGDADAGPPRFSLGVELCEDVWAPTPPSTLQALAGATVLANLSASNITVGKADYRRTLCAGQSRRCVAAYLYSAAGTGESTTDLAWDGQAMVYENGEPLAEAERFPGGASSITADVDLGRLAQERMRLTSFSDCAADAAEQVQQLRRVPFFFSPVTGTTGLRREVPRFPFVPGDPARRDERCSEAYRIQVHGLKKRLDSSGVAKVVIGISGGLDSTHALIVACRTMDLLGRPRSDVLAYTMPGFATGVDTLANAHRLMAAFGVTAGEIDIRPSCEQMLRDIGHPYADGGRGDAVYDVTFENVQAGERTSHLFRLANARGGLVLGTGDLSELALGWCTYGVGDHMSHYNVNASVPKTLIQHLICWVADRGEFGDEASAVLRAILDTEITPELVPAGATGQLQSTEATVGPYELQDFNLFYLTRFGFAPSKVAFLAREAWGEKYDLATIRRWLAVFLHRFFQTSQFKRTCVPNSPKVGSGGSLSPRGDWRAPSDSTATAWLAELDENVPDG